jgi:hypothetical protein
MEGDEEPVGADKVTVQCSTIELSRVHYSAVQWRLVDTFLHLTSS